MARTSSRNPPSGPSLRAGSSTMAPGGSGADRAHDRGVDVGIGEPEHATPDAEMTHVDVAVAVEVPRFRALGAAVIRRPLLGSEELGSLGKQLRAAGHQRPRPLVQLNS